MGFLYLLIISCFWNVFTGWNKNNLCKTTVSLSKIHSLKRYISCCQFAYQIPHKTLKFNLLLDYLKSEELLSYKSFHHPNEKHHVAGYVLFFQNEIVVSFRGTVLDGKIRTELWNNINNGVVYESFAGQTVGIHRGIFNEYSQIRESLFETLVPVPLVPIIFTGHSLGGMCQIAALDYYNTCFQQSIPCKDLPIIKCITFGAYKILTDSNIFHTLNMENIRVRFKNDLVTLYPLQGVFKHAHTEDILFYHKRRFEHRIIYYKRFINSLLEEY